MYERTPKGKDFIDRIWFLFHIKHLFTFTHAWKIFSSPFTSTGQGIPYLLKQSNTKELME